MKRHREFLRLTSYRQSPERMRGILRSSALHGGGSAGLGWGGVGGRRRRPPGERRKRDLATSADRRVCAEVSNALSKSPRSVSTHRDKQGHLATGGILK